MRYGGTPFFVSQPGDITQVDGDFSNQKADGTLADVPGQTEPITAAKSRILLVSAVFPLPKMKYPQEKYDEWLKNYLITVTTDVYLYTTPEMGPQFQTLRKSGLKITVDTTYTTPFEIPPLKGKEELYLRIQKKDRERGRRSNMTENYAVRNSKAFFLDSAVRTLKAKGENYEFAFWNDAASFRNPEHQYRDWPSSGRLQEVWEEGSQLTGTAKEDLVFVPVFDAPHTTMSFWSENMGPIDNKFSEGSFFGGTPAAIDWFARTFYAYHDHYLSLEIFIGKDISLINTLFFLFPEHFITVWHNDPDAPAHLALHRTDPEDSFLGQCGSAWHYYQFWLSDTSTKEAMRDLWIRNATRWRLWGWWRSVDKTRCQDTRVLGVVDVLKRQLGAGWRAPGRMVNVPDKLNWT
ncbi:hypothetical protein GALMADRAFT_77116 [Galerina marginata CBS 339.88]|uniref:Uncharacterized protein n=1 Tax=Galerina marginata (strain CBS 339.88) TaxID=685588 RepID=A0A067SQ95_GALM3|nr:hypothetical protein GALMADRAFT_77116 [Galerina marginata CBS 339.88]